MISDLAELGLPIETRPPDPSVDAIDGIVPGTVLEPQTAEGVAATLAWASRHRLSVVIRGAGTKTAWGRIPGRIDVLLSVRALNGIVSHRQGDLTVTVEAGASLHDLNQALSAHGQWLPLDPPFADRATIGGVLATNDSGPQRHRFGTPRDLVIGVQLATTDGHLCKSGGQVVKNVAGYDLSKIMSGSFGTLAAIVSATFKLSPVPPASRTIVIEDLTTESAVQVVETIATSQLEPVAFELLAKMGRAEAPSIACLLRFASFTEVVNAEAANASARIAAIHRLFRVVAGDDERQLWVRHNSRPFDDPGVIVRASWLPAELGRLLAMLAAFSTNAAIELVARPGVGSGLIRVEGAGDSQADVVRRMRESPVLGNVVVRRAPADLRSREWVWGPSPAGPLLAALKRELDPNGTLGAGRAPL